MYHIVSQKYETVKIGRFLTELFKKNKTWTFLRHMHIFIGITVTLSDLVIGNLSLHVNISHLGILLRVKTNKLT